MSRFYIGFFAIMAVVAVAFAGVAIPQVSEQSIARNHKNKNENNDNNNNKLTICHIPPDNPDNPQTIEIKRSALQEHLDHGDLECECDPDGDGVLCDVDQCDDDPNKIEPGVCGCGVADTDSDGDNVADCNDACPNDPDNDADGDGVCGDVDGCPADPNKTEPGQCGCGTPDVDTDGDNTADCNDGCVDDPNKTVPGVCGCGVADTDTDGDNTADCNDGCVDDPGKTQPGVCGCGVADTDNDSDGIADCNDQCPGLADDADMDGYLSCVDDCDDNNPGVNPGELLDAQCDGIDSDCSEGLGGCEPLCKHLQCLGKGCEEVSDGCGGTITCDPIDNDGDNCDCLVDCDDNDSNIRPSNCNGDGISKFDKDCDGIDSDCSEGVGGCEPLCNNSLGCATAGVACGNFPDGCGGTIDCTEAIGCNLLESCVFGQCCQPLNACFTSPETGQDCGLIPDGCGRFNDCGPCPEGFTCNEETNKCEDLNACVPDCPIFTDRATCGTSDGCGGECTGCFELPSEMTCILDDGLASAFSQAIAGATRSNFCAPLCSSSLWECGPCLNCNVTSVGTICEISENFCDPGFKCEFKAFTPVWARESECVQDPSFTPCGESCNYRETCNPDTGKCECCAEDPIFGEICSVCITDAFQVCSAGAGGSVCCNQLNLANVCL